MRLKGILKSQVVPQFAMTLDILNNQNGINVLSFAQWIYKKNETRTMFTGEWHCFCTLL